VGKKATFDVCVGSGISPTTCNVAFASCDVRGNPGPLNAYVLEELGYGRDAVGSMKELESGWARLEGGKAPVILVVTVGTSDNTSEALKKNLTLAIAENLDFLKGKRIWLPLMGTGSGRLSLEQSLHMTAQAIDLAVTQPPRTAFRESTICFAFPSSEHDNVPRFKRALGQWVRPSSTVDADLSPAPADTVPPDSNLRPQADIASPDSNLRPQADTVSLDSNLKPPADTAPLDSNLRPVAFATHDSIPPMLDPAFRASEHDSLNAKAQADVFASLLTSEDVKPPFALALLGEWGVGKSFFMRLIQERVAAVSGVSVDAVSTVRVAQIEFNAWHYVDSDLWASLASRIFDALAKELNCDTDKIENTRQQLHGRIESSKREQAVAKETIEAAKATRQKAAEKLGREQAKRALAVAESEKYRLKRLWDAIQKASGNSPVRWTRFSGQLHKMAY
jgi:hypothetical protein